jgi:hypothetical protein
MNRHSSVHPWHRGRVPFSHLTLQSAQFFST